MAGLAGLCPCSGLMMGKRKLRSLICCWRVRSESPDEDCEVEVENRGSVCRDLMETGKTVVASVQRRRQFRRGFHEPVHGGRGGEG